MQTVGWNNAAVCLTRGGVYWFHGDFSKLAVEHGLLSLSQQFLLSGLSPGSGWILDLTSTASTLGTYFSLFSPSTTPNSPSIFLGIPSSGILSGTFRYSYLLASTSKIPSSPLPTPFYLYPPSNDFLGYKGFAATYNINGHPASPFFLLLYCLFPSFLPAFFFFFSSYFLIFRFSTHSSLPL